MFFALTGKNLGSVNASFNALETYRLYLSFSGSQPSQNLTLGPFLNLAPNQEMEQGVTMPIQVTTTIIAVSLIPSAAQPIGQTEAQINEFSPMASSYWYSYMTSISGFWLDQWGGAPTPSSSSSGTTFYSWQANAQNSYDSGDVWTTLSTYLLSNTGDGFDTLLATNTIPLTPTSPYPPIEMAEFVSSSCPGSSTDSEYGFTMNNYASSSYTYFPYVQYIGTFTWYPSTSSNPLTSMNSYSAYYSGSTLYFYDNGYSVLSVSPGPSVGSACFSIGWNSQSQYPFTRNNPSWYLSTDLVTLSYN